MNPDLPPRILSEYERFIKLHGDPITCNEPRFAKIAFSSSCNNYPYSKFQNIIERWQKDEKLGPRHWPVMAFAVDQYVFVKKETRRWPAAPRPQEVRELIQSIENTAHSLANLMGQLQNLSLRVEDGASPFWQPHLGFLEQLISSATALSDNSDHWLVVEHKRNSFMQTLANIETLAGEANKRIDPKLLRRPRPAKDRGLRRLVAMAKPIWKSLTGRRPSVNKTSAEVPDFVAFVQKLARVGGGEIPTARQVEVAFKSRVKPHLMRR